MIFSRLLPHSSVTITIYFLVLIIYLRWIIYLAFLSSFKQLISFFKNLFYTLVLIFYTYITFRATLSSDLSIIYLFLSGCHDRHGCMNPSQLYLLSKFCNLRRIRFFWVAMLAESVVVSRSVACEFACVRMEERRRKCSGLLCSSYCFLIYNLNSS
jgi:hypothetical protein